MMNKINRTLILFPLIILFAGCANSSNLTQVKDNNSSIKESTVASTKTFSYEDYAAVLATYVDEKGLVDYERLQANRQQLDAFNTAVANIPLEVYQSWSEKEQIAFLMNAYNSFTLQSIIDQNPLKKSIRDIPGVWKSRKFDIVGQAKTLNNIEHDTLRVDFNEPRLHVALVCAAISCPPLRNEPYTAQNLDSQLDDQVRKFIASPHGFRLDREENSVYLSSIFKWYGDDWKQSYGVENKFKGNAKQRAVLNFLSNYLNPQDQEYLTQNSYKISYLNYDWSLNKQ